MQGPDGFSWEYHAREQWAAAETLRHRINDLESLVQAQSSALDQTRLELEQLKTNRDYWMTWCQRAQEQRDGANAQLAIVEGEVKCLRADLAEARAALRALEPFLQWPWNQKYAAALRAAREAK